MRFLREEGFSALATLYDTRNLPMLYLATFFLRAAFGAMMLLGPLYMAEIGYSQANGNAWMIGIALGAYNVGQMSTVTYFGRLSDRAGVRKPFLVLGSTTAAAAFMLFPLYTDFVMLTFANLLQGIGAAATVGPSLAMVSELSDESQRGRNMGLFETSTYAGLAVGFLTGGMLWDMPFDTGKFGKYTFYVFAFVLLLAALIFMLRMKEIDPRIKGTEIEITPIQYRILSEKTFYGLAVGIALIGVAYLFLVRKWTFSDFFKPYSYAEEVTNSESWLFVIFIMVGIIASLIGALIFSIKRRQWGIDRVPRFQFSSRKSTLKLLHNPKFQLLLPPWFAVMTVIGTITTFGPIILRGGDTTTGGGAHEGMSVSAIGVMFVLAMLVLGGTQIGFGKLTDRFGRMKLMITGVIGVIQTMALATFILLGWLPLGLSVGGAISGLLLVLSAMQATAFGPAALAALGDAAEKGKHGESAGLYSLIQGLGDMMGALIGGFIFQLGGSIGIMIAMTFLSLFALAWLILLPRLVFKKAVIT